MKDMEKKMQEFVQGKGAKNAPKYAIAIVIIAILGSIVWGLVSGAATSFLSQRGVDVDLNSGSVKLNDSKLWPQYMPKLVPRITKGVITNSIEEQDLWNVSFKEMQPEFGEEFKQGLIDNGWDLTRDTSNEQSMRVHAQYNLLVLEYTQNFEVGSAKLKVQRFKEWELEGEIQRSP